MTREELEAVVRAQLTRVVANALQAGLPSTGIMNRATETILAAHDAATATALGEIDHYRRTPAKRTTNGHHAGQAHFGNQVSACGQLTSASPLLLGGSASMTTDPAAVTCTSCKRSRAWKAAAA